MESKIQDEFIDHGLGFPVKLHGVRMVKVRGAWTPQINYDALSKLVLVGLAFKKARLSGDEIKYIRLQQEMTLQEFAHRFDVSHVAVLKWEKSKSKATAINWSTEKDIRLFILSQLEAKPTELAKLYRDLEEVPASKGGVVEIEAKEAA